MTCDGTVILYHLLTLTFYMFSLHVSGRIEHERKVTCTVEIIISV